MSPRFSVETQNEDRTMMSHSLPDNTFYLGHVSLDESSLVALSTHRGLVTNFSPNILNRSVMCPILAGIVLKIIIQFLDDVSSS